MLNVYGRHNSPYLIAEAKRLVMESRKIIERSQNLADTAVKLRSADCDRTARPYWRGVA